MSIKKLVVLWACWAAWWGRSRGGDGRLGDRDILSSSVESLPLLASFCASIDEKEKNFGPLFAKLHLLLGLPPFGIQIRRTACKTSLFFRKSSLNAW